MTWDPPEGYDKRRERESYTHPYYCSKEGCDWRGKTMTEAELHYEVLGRAGHDVRLSTSTPHDVQIFPAEDEEDDNPSVGLSEVAKKNREYTDRHRDPRYDN